MFNDGGLYGNLPRLEEQIGNISSLLLNSIQYEKDEELGIKDLISRSFKYGCANYYHSLPQHIQNQIKDYYQNGFQE